MARNILHKTIAVPPDLRARIDTIAPFGDRTTATDRLRILLARWQQTEAAHRPAEPDAAPGPERAYVSFEQDAVAELDAVGHPALRRWERLSLLVQLHEARPPMRPTEQQHHVQAIRSAVAAYVAHDGPECGALQEAFDILAHPLRPVKHLEVQRIVGTLRARMP